MIPPLTTLADHGRERSGRGARGFVGDGGDHTRGKIVHTLDEGLPAFLAGLGFDFP
jgi:hypothetical protein